MTLTSKNSNKTKGKTNTKLKSLLKDFELAYKLSPSLTSRQVQLLQKKFEQIIQNKK